MSPSRCRTVWFGALDVILYTKGTKRGETLETRPLASITSGSHAG